MSSDQANAANIQIMDLIQKFEETPFQKSYFLINNIKLVEELKSQKKLNEDLQKKYDALEKAVKEQAEILKAEHQGMLSQLEEKVKSLNEKGASSNDVIKNLTTKLQHHKRLDLLKRNAHLSDEEHTESQMSNTGHIVWQFRYNLLEDTIRGMEVKHKVKLSQLEEEVKSLNEKCASSNDEIKNLTTKLQQHTILDLMKKKKVHFSDELHTESEMLNKCNGCWVRYEFHENTVRDLEVKHLVNLSQLEVKIQSLTEKIETQNEAWQNKYKAVEEKSVRDLALEEKQSETLNVEHQGVLSQLEEKVKSLTDVIMNLTTKLQHHTRRDLLKRNAHLSDEEHTESKMLNTSNIVWQFRYDLLEDTIRDMKVKHKVKLSQLEEEVKSLTDVINNLTMKLQQHTRLGLTHLSDEVKSQSEMLNKTKGGWVRYEFLENTVRDLEVKHLLNLSQLEVKIKILTERIETQNEAWQNEYEALKEKSVRDQALEEEQSETLNVEHQVFLSQSNKAWQDRCNALEEKSVFEEEQSETLKVEHKVFVSQLEEKIQSLTGQCASSNDEIRQVRAQSVILEDICLGQKKKSLGVFGRSMQDRVTELDKMKHKMLATRVTPGANGP
ncbi:hypothetical protein EYF80_017500 [Liparis tanakae]|uniref:Uncharacterized protein n=1 Tax=Liparis tanakae TaxID=230148 RepID=A0A4Z2I2B8_9TELE|nr:hypothetical protein EYF80_017500 [Liparis tanakae]